MALNNLHDSTTLIPLFATSTKTASANGTGVDISAYGGKLVIVLDSAAGGGTTPTLDIKIQESDTSGGTYSDVSGAVFTQVVGVASAQKIGVAVDPRKKYLRAVATIAGTTPTFTFSVNAIGAKQYA